MPSAKCCPFRLGLNVWYSAWDVAWNIADDLQPCYNLRMVVTDLFNISLLFVKCIFLFIHGNIQCYLQFSLQLIFAAKIIYGAYA